MKYRLKVYYWNPNGTNDVEIVDCKALKVVASIPEALFGVNIKGEFEFINPRWAMKHIACSPVNYGSETAKLIESFFKKVGAK